MSAFDSSPTFSPVTDTAGNATTESGGLDTSPPYPTWAAALIIIVCSLIVAGTIIGNTLVCTAVSIVKKLRTPSNWLIVSLAVADLLVAVLVMPLAIVYEIKGHWPLNNTVCDAWTSLDVLLCTASILNLCMISVDRYFVITRPFQYAMKRTPARMLAMILSVWLLSALISIPPLFGWKQLSHEGHCEITQAIAYQFYATIGAFYLPLVVMIVIYARIYAVSKRISAAEARSKPSSHGRSSSGTEATAIFPSAGSKNSFDTSSSKRLDANSGRPSLASSSSHHKNSDDTSGVRKNLSFLSRHSHMHRVPSISKDTKATKTLGVIMGAFTCCWLPFFILALVKPFCADSRHCIPVWLNSLFLWLGYANSFLNPIIYARFNRDFRTPFKEILLCRCRGIDRRLRSESYTEQFGSGQHPQSPTHGHNDVRSSFAFTATAARPSNVVDAQINSTTANNRHAGQSPSANSLTVLSS